MDDSVQNSHKSPKGVVGRTISSVMRSLRQLAVGGNYSVLTTMEKPQDENKPALFYPVALPQKTIDESLSPVTSELMPHGEQNGVNCPAKLVRNVYLMTEIDIT